MVETILVCWCGFWSCPLPQKEGAGMFFWVSCYTQERSERGGHTSLVSWEDACPVSYLSAVCDSPSTGGSTRRLGLAFISRNPY